MAGQRAGRNSPDALDVAVLLRVWQGRDNSDVQVARGLSFPDVLRDGCCDVVVYCFAGCEVEDLPRVDEYLACPILRSGVFFRSLGKSL